MFNTKDLIIETTLPYSCELVWNALTQKEQMKEWYFSLDAFEPKVGFEFEFEGKGNTGETYLHLCKILAATPLKKLKHTWVYKNLEGYSEVSFEMESGKNETFLKLTHTGLHSFPQNNPDFAQESFQKGWTQLITHLLPEYLKKKHG